jgi:hypothetical protein
MVKWQDTIVFCQVFIQFIHQLPQIRFFDHDSLKYLHVVLLPLPEQ